jgi:hypothetical protein
MELLGEWAMWNLVSVHLETVLVSLQYRCTICAERTIGSKIVLDAPDGTPMGRGSSGKLISVCLQIVLILTQYRCTVCAKRTIGSENVLNALDGSLR